MGLFRRNLPLKNDPASFWRWFADHKAEFVFDGRRGPSPALVRNLTRGLHAYNQELVWEAGPDKEGVMELTISANGMRDQASSVNRLSLSPPSLQGGGSSPSASGRKGQVE